MLVFLGRFVLDLSANIPILPFRFGTQGRLVLLLNWYPHFLDQSYGPGFKPSLTDKRATQHNARAWSDLWLQHGTNYRVARATISLWERNYSLAWDGNQLPHAARHAHRGLLIVKAVPVELLCSNTLSSILSSTRVPTDTGCDELNVNGKWPPITEIAQLYYRKSGSLNSMAMSEFGQECANSHFCAYAVKIWPKNRQKCFNVGKIC